MSIKETIETPKIVVPKGVATIQLFNESGDLVQEQKKENYINPSMIKAMEDFGAYYHLAINANTSISDNNRNTGEMANTHGHNELSNDTGFSRRALVEGIVLTDNDKPLNPSKDRYYEGNIIGHASKDVVGGHERRGSYNNIESYHSIDYHKWVFDFATSEGNGTFQSIYTGRFRSWKYDDYPQIIPVALMKLDMGIYPEDIAVAGDCLYMLLGYYELYRVPLSVLTEYHSSGKTSLKNHPQVEMFNLKELYSSGFTSMALRGDRVYLFGRSYITHPETKESGKGIFSFPVNDFYNITEWHWLTVDDFSDVGGVTSSSGLSYLYSFNYNPSNDTFIFYKNVTNYGDSESQGVYIMDAKTKRIVDRKTPITNWNNIYTEIFQNQPIAFVYGYLRDLSSSNWGTDRGYISGVSHYTELNDTYSLTTSTNYLYLIPSAQFFSRVLLDSPVTKTSQNTMKITYEYTLTPLDLSNGFK